MPPHPDLLKRVKSGAIAEPYFLSHWKELRERGVNVPVGAGMDSGFMSGQRKETFKALAILVDFSDNTASTAAGYFDDLLYGDGPGTMADYWQEVTYGNLTITTLDLPSALGWERAPQPYSHYVAGQTGFGPYPHNAQKLAEDAVALADPFVDFSSYDNDSDGYVDALFIVHSGPGAEYTGSPDDIWSHMWHMNDIQWVDGVGAYVYSMEPEYWEAPGDMTCGVYSHEMGHSVFNLPDLYDYEYDSMGLGDWSLMASGSWNGPLAMGRSPAHPDAWCRIKIGVASPINVTSNLVGATIGAVEDTPELYRLWTNGELGLEYFLVENRQQTGYDAFLPGQGLLIYHVDDTMSDNDHQWYPGHTDFGHYLVALEQADGQWELEKNTNQGDEADPYPGSLNSLTFDETSIPNSRDYGFSRTDVVIRNISEPGPTMTADLFITSDYIPGELYLTLEPVYPPGQDHYEPGDHPEFNMTVRDPGNGYKFVDAERARLWKSPPGEFLTPIEHISTGHYHFYHPGLYAMGQGWYTFSFLVEKSGYYDSGTSLRLPVGDVSSYCESPSVTGLAGIPSHFCPDTSSCPVRITSYLSHPCQMDAAVYRTANSDLVRTLFTNQGKTAGPDTVFWDMKDNGGSFVAADDSYYVHCDIRRFVFDDLGDFGPELTEPSGIDIGDCGNGKKLYVADRENHRVYVYDLNGSYVGEFGSVESGDLWYPEDVAVLGDYIYVADLRGDGRIQRFTCNYTPGPAIHINGGYPIGLAAGPDGNLYVGNNFLRKYDPDLNLITEHYYNPFQITGLCVSPDTSIYATVMSGRKLYKFNADLDSVCVISVPSSGYSPDVDCRETPWGLWLYHRNASSGIRVYDVSDCSWTAINSYGLDGLSETAIAVDDAYITATQSETVRAKSLCDASGRSSLRVPLWSDGECCAAGIATDEWAGIRRLTLSAIRPNPASGAASIDYDVTRDGQISLNVYDARGRLVENLVDQPHMRGHFTVTWTGRNATGTPRSPGIYFIRLEAGDEVATRKVVLIQ
jgi:immune inhibitor A